MMDRFLKFSTEMTAFTAFDLEGTGVAEAYFNTVSNLLGAARLGQLLDIYQSIGVTQQPLRDERLRQKIFGDELFGPIARNIIKLWYLGIWEPMPQAWIAGYGQLDNNNIGFTVSARAYTEGLLWPAVGANPPGAKAPGYASWVSKPLVTLV